jgi:thioredoxin 1
MDEKLEFCDTPEPLTVDRDDFKEKVISSKDPILVFFSSKWCRPCVALFPMVEKVCKEWEPPLKLYKCNVEGNMSITRKYYVMSVPTVLVFRAGVCIYSILSKTEAGFKGALKEALTYGSKV